MQELQKLKGGDLHLIIDEFMEWVQELYLDFLRYCLI